MTTEDDARCPDCGAARGQGCITSGGRPREPHPYRYRPLPPGIPPLLNDLQQAIAAHLAGRRLTERQSKLIDSPAARIILRREPVTDAVLRSLILGEDPEQA